MLFNNNLNHDILKKYLQFLETILQEPQCYQHKIHEWISTESSETKTKVIKGQKYSKEPIRSQSKSTQKKFTQARGTPMNKSQLVWL